MKKILVVCLAVVMLLSMSLVAFAEPGSFQVSPSTRPAPQLVSGKNVSEGCAAQIIITAYVDRDELPEETRKKIEEAYSMIVGAEHLGKLSEAIAKLAKERGVDVEDLAVSDLFDISATDCNAHVEHGHFDITLKADTLNNFFALLHYYNGEWRIVENAEVTNNGEHLEFDEDEFSPFAIVVNVGEPAVPAQTKACNLWLIILIIALILLTIIILIAKSKKKKNA